jgi:hypothetical protein
MTSDGARLMATGENAAVVRRAYETFNTAVMDTLVETFDLEDLYAWDEFWS